MNDRVEVSKASIEAMRARIDRLAEALAELCECGWHDERYADEDCIPCRALERGQMSDEDKALRDSVGALFRATYDPDEPKGLTERERYERAWRSKRFGVL